MLRWAVPPVRRAAAAGVVHDYLDDPPPVGIHRFLGCRPCPLRTWTPTWRCRSSSDISSGWPGRRGEITINLDPTDRLVARDTQLARLHRPRRFPIAAVLPAVADVDPPLRSGTCRPVSVRGGAAGVGNPARSPPGPMGVLSRQIHRVLRQACAPDACGRPSSCVIFASGALRRRMRLRVPRCRAAASSSVVAMAKNAVLQRNSEPALGVAHAQTLRRAESDHARRTPTPAVGPTHDGTAIAAS